MGQTPVDVSRGEPTVRVFVRPSSPAAPVDETLRRLQQLEAEGGIDALSVRVWPDAVPLSSDTVDTQVVQCYERFATWADREGMSIEPPFVVRTRHSSTTGETREVLTPPVLCLAIYENGTLASVYPRADEEGHRTVADAVEALGAGKFRPGATDGPESPGVDACPECGTDVVNVQGLETCHHCTWVVATGTDRKRTTATTR